MRFTAEDYAMRLLDYQYSYINRDAQGLPTDVPGNEKQLWYYKGLRTAFEIALSDGYTKRILVEVDNKGRHSIVEYDHEE